MCEGIFVQIPFHMVILIFSLQNHTELETKQENLHQSYLLRSNSKLAGLKCSKDRKAMFSRIVFVRKQNSNIRDEAPSRNLFKCPGNAVSCNHYYKCVQVRLYVMSDLKIPWVNLCRGRCQRGASMSGSIALSITSVTSCLHPVTLPWRSCSEILKANMKKKSCELLEHSSTRENQIYLRTLRVAMKVLSNQKRRSQIYFT